MKKLFLLVGLLVAVSGCSKNSVDVPGEPSELTLSGKTLNIKSAKSVLTKDGAAGTDGTLPATAIGVYVLTTSGSNPDDFISTAWKNCTFVSDAAGAISGSGVTLRTGTSYDVYAYAPRVDADIADIHAIPIEHGKDILWVPKQNTTATAGGTTVVLQFQHKGAQIGFQLVAQDGVTNLDHAKLKVEGFYNTGTLDLESGTTTVVDPTGIIADNSGRKTNILVSGASMTLAVTVTNVPGKPEPFKGTITKIFEAGKSYLYTVNINMDGDPVTFDPKIEEWTNVTSTEIPVQ